jgi:N-acyl-L-amino-acid amidohydrolase
MDCLLFLQKYLQINTAHPRPDYAGALKFLLQCARDDLFNYTIINLPSGRDIVILSVIGTDPSLPALVLNHHMDVVPAQAGTFDVDPFGGCVIGDKIIGRGVQDMKGVAAVHYGALKFFKQKYKNIRRTVYLVAVPDEELGGFSGTEQFIGTEIFKKLNVGFVLDEGLPSGDHQKLLIKISERRPIQIKFISTGALGHSSCLSAQNSVHDLVFFLQKLVLFQEEQKIKARDCDNGLLLSVHITGLNTPGVSCESTCYNTIQSCAEAIVDFRLPASMTNDFFYGWLNGLLRNFVTITYKVLAATCEYSHDYCALQTSEFFNTLYSVVQSAGIHPVSYHAEASSDLRFYWGRGIIGLGFTPFTDVPNLHGNNESLFIKSVIFGQEIIFGFLEKFCL